MRLRPFVAGYAYASDRVPPAYRWSIVIAIRITTARASAQRCTPLSWERSACSDITAPTPESRSRTLQASDCTRPWASSRPAHFTKSVTSSEHGETSYGWSTCWATPTSPLRSRWVSLSCSHTPEWEAAVAAEERSCANAHRRSPCSSPYRRRTGSAGQSPSRRCPRRNPGSGSKSKPTSMSWYFTRRAPTNPARARKARCASCLAVSFL